MANKFIVFVAIAVAAQASLAAADVNSARERSRTAWRQVGEVLCKAVQDESFSIQVAKDEYRKHQAAGGVAFLSVAPNGRNQKLRDAATGDSTTFRDRLFKAVQVARTCKNHRAALSAIEKNKNGLPYAKFVNDFHKLTRNTGSTTQGVTQLQAVYGKLYAEVEKLAGATCGGQKAQAACAVNDIHAAVDAMTNTVYSWL